MHSANGTLTGVLQVKVDVQFYRYVRNMYKMGQTLFSTLLS